MYLARMCRLQGKKRLNDIFAKVGKGLSHANRLQLLELLAQGERDVESLASCSGMSVANTSHHLKLLRECGLISSRREGQRVIHTLADDSIVSLIAILHSIAMKNLPELDRLLADVFLPDETPEEITPNALEGILDKDHVRVFDLRPREEYEAGHVPGAEFATLEILEELPDAGNGALCVVYCRGNFCLFPTLAARVLVAKGYVVKRLSGGFPAWRISKKTVAAC